MSFLVYHSTAIILIILIGLSAIAWFMFDILGASITIATSIIAIGVGLGVVVWDGFRRQRQSLEKTYAAMDVMNKYLGNTSKAGIYEKIAMLNGYINNVSDWKDSKIITNKICFDIEALWHLKSTIGDNEIAELSAAINSLTKAMKSKTFEEDADRIEHKSKPLFSS
ncbi:hypothetical protein DYY65_01475 [Nitrososphaera sp. AFS]|nr:hypothetical protein [Nitrososphaera sp. AFS]